MNAIQGYQVLRGVIMPIPDFQSVMLPLLKLLQDRQEYHVREAESALAKDFNLTEAEVRELLPSGTQAVFRNRIGWAKSYLKQAKLLDSPKRGYMRITERGLAVLAEAPQAINMKYLERFEEYRQFKARKRSGDEETNNDSPITTSSEQTPQEALEAAYETMREELVSELLEQIKNSPPRLFEHLVVELLVKMGYGGSRKDAGQAIGRSGDEGIDGIIKEDRLGLDIIYVQAKRWGSTVVGRPEIHKFAGALQGQRARKGVFITTSSFTKEARDFASLIDTKIVLIDGEELAQLLIDHNVAVTPVRSYEVKRVDSDYFTEE
ncbi:MAG: restriction endonuclease [Desulfobacteraceae bacterium]|nr:restriction endonuclease [Desulfobacteraceae bacterium]MDD3993127.1 restriction endonuclease [Desulfobacteraceae bacterium]